jgi:hypothetical protein
MYDKKRITVETTEEKARLLVAFLMAESIDFELSSLPLLKMDEPPVVHKTRHKIALDKLVRSKAKPPKVAKKLLTPSAFAFAPTNKVLIAILSTARGANVAGENGFTAREVMRSCVSLGLRESNAGAGLSKSIHLGLIEHKGKNNNGKTEYALTTQGWELVHKLLPDVPNQPSP